MRGLMKDRTTEINRKEGPTGGERENRRGRLLENGDRFQKLKE